MAPTAPIRSWAYPTLADVVDRVGGVPPERVLVCPAAGTATEDQLFDNLVTGGQLYELVDGILVVKRTRRRKDPNGARVARAIRVFLADQDVGFVPEPDRPVRLRPGLVRRPDVSFTSWDTAGTFEDLMEPGSPSLGVAPDLVVDVLTPSNSAREVAIKLGEYATAGVQLVWYVDPAKRETTVYPRGREQDKEVIGLGGVLDGGDVLPGFTLPVAKIFEKRAPAKKGSKKSKPGRG